SQYLASHDIYTPAGRRRSTPVKPRRTIRLVGESTHTLQRVVDICDGWYPRGVSPEIIVPGIEELKRRAAKAGRDFKTISISVFGARPDQATLDAYAKGGVTRAILRLPSEGRDKILPLLDQYAKLIR